MMVSEIQPSSQAANGAVSPIQAQPMAGGRAVLALEGMTCASCAMRIEKGLKKVPGVKDASVNFATEQATVAYDPAQTNVEQMVQKVEVVGYKATPQVASAQQTVQENGTVTVTVAGALVPPASSILQEDEQSK